MDQPAPRTLAEQLALEQVDEDVFVGAGAPVVGSRVEDRVFGGLLVAHALRAAHATVAGDRIAHSLHSAFLRAGRTDEPLRYEVERTHNGGSFSTRRVVARQSGDTVFVLTGKFQVPEDGPHYQPPAGPMGVAPDGLEIGRYDGPFIESRDVPPDEPGQPRHARTAWFRARSPLPDDPVLHQHALAYLSDHGPTRAVREPHVGHLDLEQRISVSLDHAVWFHRPARVDDWLRYQLVPATTVGGRGLAIGTIHTPGGTLVATVTQEAMLRIPS